ncbi:hypothetical protein [Paenibacillus sp. DYY-L-2]|uniref:hypothetical protein n=1 Tax=Paenibacillus sp. DYY-L-2 TaxID=3447013 RepID=UPI003F4FF6B3
MKNYAAIRKASDLLTRGFFEYVMNRNLSLVQLPPSIEWILFEYVQQHTPKKVEVGIGFQKLKDVLGMGALKLLYKSSTLDERNSLMKELGVPSTSLPPLEIDYLQM